MYMSPCKDSIQDYLYFQEQIKQNMQKLQDKCPNKVIKFLLARESQTTLNKMINCSWSDSMDKKYLSKLLKIKCEDL